MDNLNKLRNDYYRLLDEYDRADTEDRPVAYERLRTAYNKLKAAEKLRPSNASGLLKRLLLYFVVTVSLYAAGMSLVLAILIYTFVAFVDAAYTDYKLKLKG